MNLLEKSLQVRQVFDELQLETDRFISQSKVSCIQGCGLCCTNPKVSAAVIEFLPLAFDLYHRGRAEEFLSLLSSATEDSYCVILKKMSVDADAGQCSDYQNRGLICRLFASSARKNKTGEKELLICKKIKEYKKEAYEAAAAAVNQGLDVPLSTDYYTRLYNIDFDLTQEQVAINIAIRKAIEEVLRHFWYMDEGTAV
jgi:Fe-S-cluster containining protein